MIKNIFNPIFISHYSYLFWIIIGVNLLMILVIFILGYKESKK